MTYRRELKIGVARGCLAVTLWIFGGGAPALAEPTAPPPVPPAAPDAAPPALEPAKRVVRTFKVYADNWNWTPETLHVKQGDHVVLKLFAYRASRSFVLKAYRLDVHMPQDEEITVEFDADKKGEFPWRCGRPCGNGCAKLRGTLFVE
jgi:heme/copper-type cytochrome/quinol oxidase subunit 2